MLSGQGSMRNFASAVSRLSSKSCRFIIVNGGGKEIDTLCSRLSIDVKKEQGLRVTTPDVLDVVQMTLARKSNELASALMAHGLRSLPVPAFALGAVRCRKKVLPNGRDLGYVGEVEDVDPTVLLSLVTARSIPVIYPIGSDSEGNLYNINADELAADIASSLRASSLLLLTDVPGVMINSTVVPCIHVSELDDPLLAGHLHDGIIPKLESAKRAARSGVGRVAIIDGRRSENIENFFTEGKIVGTEIQN
ncbi:MAG: acetylglutamate kinase [Thermoplasmata archaeon YP2-bin.285]|uniref:Acetylglutamate kinase n=1 Tax=Candidatus Sysuiplasma superficiale TaxID=2823368 RepID=A0A8J8CBK0_9ARCH|nr:acetylglutamate kinase [Candidatus Sysuiplasma superficiale]